MVTANKQAQDPIQYPFYPMPDLSDEMFLAVCKANAIEAWDLLSRLRNRIAFAGRTAQIRADASQRHTIHVGYHTLSKLSGRDRKTLRRMFRSLEALGLVSIRQPQVSFTLDVKTGLIARRQHGRCQPVEITMIVTDAVMRPTKAIKERQALGENFPRDLEVGGKISTSAGGNISTTSLVPLILSIPAQTNGIGDGVAMPSSAEEEGAGHSAGKGSREESEMPALEATADPDTASEPSWTFAQGKSSRPPQNDKGDGRRRQYDKDHDDGSMPVGDSATKRRYYRSDSQQSMTDAEHDVWRRDQRAAAQRAASELAAAAAAIRPTRAKRAASECRQAATVGV